MLRGSVVMTLHPGDGLYLVVFLYMMEMAQRKHSILHSTVCLSDCQNKQHPGAKTWMGIVPIHSLLITGIFQLTVG